MKIKYLLLLFFVAFQLPTFAQNKVVKYCEVITVLYGLSDKIKAEISIGKVDSLFSLKDTNLKVQLQKVNNLKTSADVLNYMTSIGWTFINSPANYFIFKREFDPSELTTTSKP